MKKHGVTIKRIVNGIANKALNNESILLHIKLGKFIGRSYRSLRKTELGNDTWRINSRQVKMFRGILKHGSLVFYEIHSTDRRYPKLTATAGNMREAWSQFKRQKKAIRQSMNELVDSVAEKRFGVHGYFSVKYIHGRNKESNRYHTIYTDPGTILKVIERKKAARIFDHKKPKTDERHFGLELEFISPLSYQDMAVRLSKLKSAEYLRLTTDGSIEAPSGKYGLELNVILPESKRDEILDEVLTELNSLGAHVNKTCGMHLHVDVRNTDRKKEYENLIGAQRVLYAMQPASRRSGSHMERYCKIQKQRDVLRAMGLSRYHGINAQAIRKYGTIELRMHAGTIDRDKVKNFIELTRSIISNDNPPKRAITSIDSFIKRYKIDTNLANYVKSRVDKFKGPCSTGRIEQQKKIQGENHNVQSNVFNGYKFGQ